MQMNQEQQKLYSQTMENAFQQMEGIDQDIEEELERTREKLNELKESKKVFEQIYDSASRLLELDP
jgi:hypothetical protein